jgi:hypothetical protein
MPAPKSPDAADAADTPAPARRRWEKPRVDSGQLFESNSLACSKSGPQVEECLQGGEPKS